MRGPLACVFGAIFSANPVHAEAPDARAYEVTEIREACADHDPLRNVYFGDLHVHTSFSQDASARGTRNTPRDAYRFAKGERLGIQPYDERGVAYQTQQLSRPLDFAAVTDHAELLGEVHICETPDLPGNDSWTCGIYRRWPQLAFFLMNARASRANPIRFAFCGTLGVYCLEAALTPWTEIRLAAETAYDRTSACSFTSFIGYEWTGSRGSNNIHRNVIFRNDRSVDLPISFYEESKPEGLWRELRRQCLERGDGCDAIVIPHNSNLSNGLMFRPKNTDGSPLTESDATTRSELERVIEIMQHKGDSECRLGAASEDELCGFEKLSFGNLAGMYLPFLGNPEEPLSYVRNALKEGLKQEAKLGVNPFKLGIIAATDTHVGTPGAVREERHLTHMGRGKSVRKKPPRPLLEDVEFNPGGLAGIWAEENSRDALFAALRRREVFGTSGPRIPLRFFGSWDPEWDLCSSNRFAERGYAEGVPMGADLPPPPPEVRAGGTAYAPSFAVFTARDPGPPGRPGNLLQRVQIIKGWVEDDEAHEAVYDVAGRPAGAASVDVATCQTSGPGADSLCSVWVDPDFDPDEPAFYYARVLENPSCRWTTILCAAHAVDCGDEGSADAELWQACCESGRPATIQERAWSSPIWYAPGRAGAPAAN